jgi:O-antigen/teichoic acid export membrane protein
MNVSELKAEWTRYHEKLSLTRELNDQLISGILKERSRSRITAIRRSNSLFLLYMFIILSFLIAILAGNPFDFVYGWQYIPYMLLIAGIIIAIVSLIRSLKNFNVDLNRVDLSHFLQRTIDAYEKNRKVESWLQRIIFSGGVLTVLSFLPRKIENKGLWPAVGETSIVFGITLILYIFVLKARKFRRPAGAGFKDDLRDLEKLKELSKELSM